MSTDEQDPTAQHVGVGTPEPDELQQAVQASAQETGLLAEFRREASDTP